MRIRIKQLFISIFYVGIIVNSLFATSQELYKFNYFASDYFSLRRIREIKTEELVINYFIEQLRVKFGDRIKETHLVPEKLRELSGVDIVIIYQGINRERIYSTVGNLTYKVFTEYNEVIIPIVISKELLNSKNISIEDIFKFLEENPDFGFQNPERVTPEDFYQMGKADLELAKFAYERYEQTGRLEYLYGAFVIYFCL